MQDLVNNIAMKTGISTDKASEVLQAVSQFIKEKYPLLADTVDSVLDSASKKDDEPADNY